MFISHCKIMASCSALLFLLAMPVQADDKDITIYPLQHQTATPMLPALNAILQPGESINEYNNQLIVNASAATQKQVAQLLQQLDKPSRNLMISVRNNATGVNVDNSSGVSGGIRSGQVRLGTGRGIETTGGLVVEQNGVRIQSGRQVQHTSTQQSQQVRAIEGYPSWISTGQSAAYNSYDRYGNPNTEYVNAEQGFYVTARIIGENVQLEISTSNDKFSQSERGVIDTQQLHTSTTGAIGEWINLGGISTDSSESSNGYTTHRSTGGNGITDIAIRIVPID